MDYIKQLEEQNEELKQKLAAEQVKAKGMVSLSWTNWHPRYSKNKLMYYQTVLTSYCTHFAFARIAGKMDIPDNCKYFMASILEWSAKIEPVKCDLTDFNSFEHIKEVVQERVVDVLFKSGNVYVCKKKSTL